MKRKGIWRSLCSVALLWCLVPGDVSGQEVHEFRVIGILDKHSYCDTRIEIEGDRMTIAHDSLVHHLTILGEVPAENVIRRYQVFFLGNECTFTLNRLDEILVGFLYCPAMYYQRVYLGWKEKE